MMKLTCLVDNAVRPGSPLWGEHGLSYLIETREGCVLFDTGQSGTVLLRNLQYLGIDPGKIDALAISHAHYDHTGGLPTLLQHLRPGIPLYANPDLFRERFEQRQGTLKSIGLALTREMLASRLTLRLDTAPQKIMARVWTTGAITDRPAPQGSNAHHLIEHDGVLVPDEYRDDMAIVLEEDARLALLCGCCHAGLLNTLAHVERAFSFPIVAIVGGLHLIGSTEDAVQQCVNKLLAMPALEVVGPSHCTGQVGFVALFRALDPSKVRCVTAGTVIEIDRCALL